MTRRDAALNMAAWVCNYAFKKKPQTKPTFWRKLPPGFRKDIVAFVKKYPPHERIVDDAEPR